MNLPLRLNLWVTLILIANLTLNYSCYCSFDIDENCDENEDLCLIIKDGTTEYVYSRKIRYDNENALSLDFHKELIDIAVNRISFRVQNHSRLGTLSFQSSSYGFPCSLESEWRLEKEIKKRNYATVFLSRFPNTMKVCITPYIDRRCFKYKMEWGEDGLYEIKPFVPEKLKK